MIRNEVKVSEESLREFAREICVRVGMSPEDATIEADALLWANLRGVDSHGALRIPWYVNNVDRGIMNVCLQMVLDKLDQNCTSIMLLTHVREELMPYR